jgi:hypothetical protein
MLAHRARWTGWLQVSRGVATEEYDVIEYDVVKDDVFATDERVTLRFAPFWVLAAFAGRQRGFDQSEFEAFSRVIEEASERARGRLGGRVLQRVAMDLDRIAAAFGNDRRSVATGLYEVRGLIERLPPDEALAFRETLVCGVGEGIAKARGRYGRIISEEDGRTLELVEALLS